MPGSVQSFHILQQVGATSSRRYWGINMKSTLLALAILGATAAPALAQDYSLSPNFGSVSLQAGFSPDPHQLSLLAGGNLDAFSDTPLPGGCVGKISNAPDYAVYYDAGSLPLTFRTDSSRDTTLIINGPDGRWYCDDDSAGSLNARIRFANPGSGVYHVWVGTFGDEMTRAVLNVTELE